MPSDKDYKDTKLIKQEKANLKVEFNELADWIKATYGVRPLNIIYDKIEYSGTPRLQVCFELYADLLKFTDSTGIFPDRAKQGTIKQKFIQFSRAQVRFQSKFSFIRLLTNQFSANKTKNLHVIFTSFEAIARQEANENIQRSRIDQLKEDVADKHLWKIMNVFGGVTFFLYTDDQVNQYEQNGIKESWSKLYFKLLKEYDDFDYYKWEDFSIRLDSKENFDSNYESNWYYYYK